MKHHWNLPLTFELLCHHPSFEVELGCTLRKLTTPSSRRIVIWHICPNLNDFPRGIDNSLSSKLLTPLHTQFPSHEIVQDCRSMPKCRLVDFQSIWLVLKVRRFESYLFRTTAQFSFRASAYTLCPSINQLQFLRVSVNT